MNIWTISKLNYVLLQPKNTSCPFVVHIPWMFLSYFSHLNQCQWYLQISGCQSLMSPFADTCWWHDSSGKAGWSTSTAGNHSRRHQAQQRPRGKVGLGSSQSTLSWAALGSGDVVIIRNFVGKKDQRTKSIWIYMVCWRNSTSKHLWPPLTVKVKGSWALDLEN